MLWVSIIKRIKIWSAEVSFDSEMTVLVDHGVVFSLVATDAFNVSADNVIRVLHFFGLLSKDIGVGHQNCKPMIAKS